MRTGRRVSDIELKFNPWHDPDDGRFTFAGTGRYFPGGVRNGARTTDAERAYKRFNPRNPRNHTIYVVKPGDTLSRIAHLRTGLRVSDLAWLNNIRNPNSLRVGQRLMLPNQAYLEAGRRARGNFVNLAFYMDTHGGRLPPNVAKVPSIEEQLNSNWQRVSKNGYRFQIDVIERPRKIGGTLTLNPAQRRSRSAQAGAGGSDRLSTDHGGHYIARRFNGPRETFNHFAQDASFNIREYRALENLWAAAVRSGSKVTVDIVPIYEGTSLRPSSIYVRYVIDGKPGRRVFTNVKGGR